MNPNLKKAARLWGVQTGFRNAAKKSVESPRFALEKVLAVLSGEKVEGEESLRRLIDRAHQQKVEEVLEPVLVASAGVPLSFKLYLPENQSPQDVRVQLEQEDGKTFELKELSFMEEKPRWLRFKPYKRYAGRLPTPLLYGYHKLRVSFAEHRAQTLIVCAPDTIFPENRMRRWGLFAPLYAIRNRRNWGLGDFSDLRELQKFTAQNGGRFVGVLPLLSTVNEGEAADPSPYAPVSRLFWNEIFLDVEELISEDSSLRPEFLKSGDLDRIEKLRRGEWVEHKPVYALKRIWLQKLADRFFENGQDRRQDYRRFVEYNSLVLEYARFRSKGKKAELNFHLYVQFQLDRALKSQKEEFNVQKVCLYLDVPVGVSRNGFDSRYFSESFVSELSAGAPPDLMFSGGQNWGFAPLHPDRIRRQGYDYFIRYLRHHMRYAGILRLDHVISFHRIYAIPQDSTPKCGVFLRYKTHEFFAILKLEAYRAGIEVIGEDLGTVPDEVRSELLKSGCYRMWVIPFETKKAPKRAAHKAPRQSLACLNTHDMIPFAGYTEGRDMDLFEEMKILKFSQAEQGRRHRREEMKAWERNLNAGDRQEVFKKLMEELASGPAGLILINIEDLWSETEPQNIPGTWREYKNWRHKLRVAQEEWQSSAEIKDFLLHITQLRDQQRSPQWTSI